jgi:hypothetical protein
MVMPSENFVRLAQSRDDLLMQRSPWADENEFMIAQRLRLEAISIIEDGTRDWLFEHWHTKEIAAGRRYSSEGLARVFYRIDRFVLCGWLGIDQPLVTRLCYLPRQSYVLTSATIELERS